MLRVNWVTVSYLVKYSRKNIFDLLDNKCNFTVREIGLDVKVFRLPYNLLASTFYLHSTNYIHVCSLKLGYFCFCF